MKLLIITQKVDINDDLLGFFHKWLEEFSLYFETINVICLEKGKYSLPENVKVYSLDKENNALKIKILLNFYKYIWTLRNDYDSVFVHMNPEYVITGGLFWKIFRKKITLWYTHKLVDLKLKISEKLVDNIITVSPEGFGLASSKIKIFGHGIDVEKFKSEGKKIKNSEDLYNIIYVGRISIIKNQEMLIKASAILLERNFKNFIIKFVGGPITSIDRAYLVKLKELVNSLGLNKYIIFEDKVSYNSMLEYYNSADININLCPTGGLDKAVLEAMAMGIPVLATNTGFIKEFDKYADDLIVIENNEKDLAEKLQILSNQSQEYLKEMGGYLRDRVIKHHNLNNLIKSLADVIKK